MLKIISILIVFSVLGGAGQFFPAPEQNDQKVPALTGSCSALLLERPSTDGQTLK